MKIYDNDHYLLTVMTKPLLRNMWSIRRHIAISLSSVFGIPATTTARTIISNSIYQIYSLVLKIIYCLVVIMSSMRCMKKCSSSLWISLTTVGVNLTVFLFKFLAISSISSTPYMVFKPPLQHFRPIKTPKNHGGKLKKRCSKLRKRFCVRGKPRRCLILSEHFLSLTTTTEL